MLHKSTPNVSAGDCEALPTRSAAGPTRPSTCGNRPQIFGGITLLSDCFSGSMERSGSIRYLFPECRPFFVPGQRHDKPERLEEPEKAETDNLRQEATRRVGRNGFHDASHRARPADQQALGR